MSRWSVRSGLYKVTLVLTYFIFLVYGLAFGVPTWIGSNAGLSFFLGLWNRCLGNNTRDFDSCGTYAFTNDADWMDGVRGVWVAGMFLYLVAVIVSVVENCCKQEESKDYGITGILTILAGLCGAAGVIVVAVEVEENNLGYEYFWGYMLACITSGLAIILGIILIITRNAMASEKSNTSRTADYVFAHKQGNPYAPEYTNYGYTRDDIPLANGVNYHHTPHPATHPYTMYQGNSLPQPKNPGGMYGPTPAYQPYGYDMNQSKQRHSMAESADLSNGYTAELINAEHSLGRRGNYPRGQGDYIRGDFGGRNDYYMNGSRPY